MPVMTPVVGVVLAGGRSSRMGTSKAALEWHGSTLLRHVVGIVARAVAGPVLVVRAPAQPLPALPPDVCVLDDPREGVGPLQGLAAGLGAAAAQGATAVFVCSTDMPFLHPAFVRRVLHGLRAGVDVAMPVAHGHPQPLAAAYRTTLAADVARWVDHGERTLTTVAARRPVALLHAHDLLADAALAAADPRLTSLHNLNRPEDYRAALAVPAPLVAVDVRHDPGASRRWRAATVAGAVTWLGCSIDELVIHLDGALVTDGATPLVDGDELTVSVRSIRGARAGKAVGTSAQPPEEERDT
jgi:molybdopterin-guanine dinucleotide biosynthesis protein A